VVSEAKVYEYVWNALGQLVQAERLGGPNGGSPELTMTYRYDASGARVVREKSDVAGGIDQVRQDLYISGGYEVRQVQLQDDLGNPVSVNSASLEGARYEEVEGTRLVKYAFGARVQWKVEDGEDGLDLSEEPQIFLSFSNHLGSTTAVVDYGDGTLVSYRTSYAYGSDESEWKNSDPKYDNTDEPYGFTGKEEDEDVGLHYFGARYYSSYLGRWISPDPPVVHGGAIGNYYQYGGNSPYAASLLGNLRHWMENDPQIADLIAKLPTIRRENICNR
jgi:RHS repeat-associated protein